MFCKGHVLNGRQIRNNVALVAQMFRCLTSRKNSMRGAAVETLTSWGSNET